MTDFLNTNRNEIYRYMGVRGEAGEAVSELAEEMLAALSKNVRPKFCARDTSVAISRNTITFDSFSVKSKALAHHLSGCTSGILIGATLGIEIDRIIDRYMMLSPSRAVAAQAAAAAMTEYYADEICAVLSAEEKKSGFFLTPRFSPGYGGLSLDCQEDFLSALDARRKIGLCLTRGGLMIPVKSITAIVGRTKVAPCSGEHKCEACDKVLCEFRRL